MLRTTFCTLVSLFVSAGILAAAEPKGGTVDKSVPQTILKKDNKVIVNQPIPNKPPVAAAVQQPKPVAKPAAKPIVASAAQKEAAQKAVKWAMAMTRKARLDWSRPRHS